MRSNKNDVEHGFGHSEHHRNDQALPSQRNINEVPGSILRAVWQPLAEEVPDFRDGVSSLQETPQKPAPEINKEELNVVFPRF